ncbi:MAG: CehA/McbA family metallohydrolase [Verrucomicrobiota bacterium]
MQIRIDTHSHTSFSADGIGHPLGMMDAARKKGLQAFIITDHDTCAALDYLEQEGLIHADGSAGDDLLVLPGQEVSTRHGHLLCLGTRLPSMKGCAAAEAIEEIHARGGLAIPAHPYDRFRSGIREGGLNSLPIDGIEVFNAASTFKIYNQQARGYAAAKGLTMFAGSDAHHEDALGAAHMILDVDELTQSSVMNALRTGGELVEKYQTRSNFLKKTFHNCFRSKTPAQLVRKLEKNSEPAET